MTKTLDIEQKLRNMIINMELKPGERLKESWSERYFNTTRTPVRTAFRKMLSEGLLQRDRMGWVVTQINRSDVEQLCLFREALEIAALRISANHITKEQLAALEAILRKGYDLYDCIMVDAGSQFHLQLATLCNNTYIIKGVRESLLRLSRARSFDRALANPCWDDHRKIISMLANKQSEKAVELLTHHLRESTARQLNAISLGGVE